MDRPTAAFGLAAAHRRGVGIEGTYLIDVEGGSLGRGLCGHIIGVLFANENENEKKKDDPKTVNRRAFQVSQTTRRLLSGRPAA